MNLTTATADRTADSAVIPVQYSVVLCGTARLILQSLAESMRNEPGLEVVAIVDRLGDLSAAADIDKYVVVIADNLTDETQHTALSHVLPPHSVVMLLSDHQRTLALAIEQHAQGYVTLQDAIPDFIDVVRKVAQGGRAISPSLRHRIEWDGETQKYALIRNHVFQSLSQRQLDILARIARGDSVKDVARELDISQKSVDCHKYRIMQKLGVHDRVQITRLAIREGLLIP